MFNYQTSLRSLYILFMVSLTIWLGLPRVSQAQSNICSSVSQIPTAECQALVALYNSTGGANWTERASWLLTDTPCEWVGVTCRNEHVVTIALSNNRLHGPLPADLGDLTYLQVLDVAENQLTGKLPPELGSLRQLKWLYLNDNALSGPMPTSLMNLDNLEKLWFYHTQLCETSNAPLTVWLSSLADIQSSGITCVNNVTAASVNVPPAQSELICDQVTQISKSECMALVAVYTSTGGANWTKNENWLQSDTPCSWSGVTCTDNQVTELALSQNGLTGTIPSEIGNLKQLTSLKADGNSLDGPLPLSMAKLTKLEAIDLSGTGLCHPANKTFEGWLNKMKITGLSVCTPEQMAKLPLKINQAMTTTAEMTETETMTDSAEMTETAVMTDSADMTVSSTDETTATDMITVTAKMTATETMTDSTEMTVSSTDETTATTEMTTTQTMTPSAEMTASIATTPMTDSASAMAVPPASKAMPQSGGVLPSENGAGYLLAGLVMMGLLIGGMVFSKR